MIIVILHVKKQFTYTMS